MSQPDLDVEAMAAEVVLLVKSALAPVLEHQAAQDARLERLPIAEAMVVEFGKELVVLRERLATIEARPLMPGPPGEPGPPGKDGQDGAPGTAGLSFEGVYQDGKHYALGHLVTWAGSSWHCNEPTATKPGDGSGAWTLMVKRGRDGKDGRDAPAALPVVSVGRSR